MALTPGLKNQNLWYAQPTMLNLSYRGPFMSPPGSPATSQPPPLLEDAPKEEEGATAPTKVGDVEEVEEVDTRPDGQNEPDDESPSERTPPPPSAAAPDTPNGHAGANGHTPTPETEKTTTPSTDKLEAMSQDCEALRAEVEQLRKQLENIQSAHADEVKQLRSDLDESEAAKEHAETQYQTLLGRVEKIKQTLGDRLKRDKAELDEAKDRVEELEAQNEELQRAAAAKEEEANRLRDETQEQGRELASLRSRSNLSQQNSQKERDDLAKQMQRLKEELESTTAAMGEWEVIAMEERSQREILADKVADLEEQVASAREAYDKVASERDTQSRAIDGLQRALQEIQEARRKELREIVEASEEQVQALKKQAQEADARAIEAEAAKETLSKELERTLPFEKEVKEKNLLIGKLRHEAIVLNDHLTKALKYIKKTKPEETIDKQLVTNHFLQFLSLDRSDPKKFQILQIMAGFLNWTDEQREKAGLARPGGGGSLRLPASPFHRTPSSPALNSEFFAEPASAQGRESLSDLWANFLERSVDEAVMPGGPSRKDSTSSVMTSGTNMTRPDTRGPSGS
ncbi:putative golgi matrix protein [Cladorrhinum sp. PSN332]|nr:putative golgi matrix protein [Cladorrhinum sp. PSN332]